MKICLIHNFYQSSSPSGEDVVFRNEVKLLKQYDINVVTYERHNDEIKDYGISFFFLLKISGREEHTENSKFLHPGGDIIDGEWVKRKKTW